MADLPVPSRPGSEDERRRWEVRQEQLWADPNNWSGWLYFCKQDPRLFVPKRSRWMGWTVNWGHDNGGWVLLGLLVGIPLFQAGAIAIASYYAEGCKTPLKRQ